MKPFLILAAVTGLVLGGFWLTRDRGTDPVGPFPNASGTPTRMGAPTTQRPVVQPTSKPGSVKRTFTDSGGRKVEAEISDELVELQELMNSSDWSDMVTDETLVRMEDAWRFDFSGIDFEAPILCRVNGIEVTRDDFRRQCVLEIGNPLLRSELYALTGRRLAEDQGQPYGLTDAQFELYLRAWAEVRGLEPELGVEGLMQISHMPEEAVRKWKRDMIETMLAYFPAVDKASDFPSATNAALKDSKPIEIFAVLSAKDLGNLRENLDNPESMRKLVETLQPMAMVWSSQGDQILINRAWTYKDADLPADVVAGCYLGHLDPEQEGLPPWSYAADDVAFVRTDPLFELIRPMLYRDLMEEELRRALWASILRHELEQKGALESAEDAWAAFVEKHVRGRDALLGESGVLTMGHKFPTVAQGREAQRITRSFRAMQGPGWDDKEALRAFYPRHRFFINYWAPDLEIAVFYPVDWSGDADWRTDWDAAREKAEAFRARIDAGEEFDAVLKEHNDALQARLDELLGAAASSPEFAALVNSGHVKGSAYEVQRILGESRFERLLNCASVLQNAAVRLERNEVSPPWRTPTSYVVVRLNKVLPAMLEVEFEDVIGPTRQVFHDFHFFKWANDVLSSAQLE